MAYVATDTVEHDGKRYQAGEIIEGLDDEAAAPLLELGAVAPGAGEAAAESEPAAEKPKRGRRQA